MNKVALLVGVSEYQPGWQLLPSAIKDVKAMERVLQHPEMGSFDKVEVLTNPKSQEMRLAVHTLFANRSPEDLVLFYFSGHGVKDQTGHLYLTTQETFKDKVPPTAVPASYLQNEINNSCSEHEVIILDCCYSGAIAKGLTAKDEGAIDIIAELGGKGRAILTSSTSVQFSFQQEETLSIYTQYLVEGIETGAADTNNDGQISTDELHQYASDKVKQVSLAMTPQFYPVREGYKIYLARSPLNKPKVTEFRYLTEDLNNGVILDLVYISGGSFRMGTEDEEIERLVEEYGQKWFRREKPQHEVNVPTFYMGRYPITQVQWREVAMWDHVYRKLDPDPSRFREPYEGVDRWQKPVESISWEDAQEFCARLSRRTKRDYRLPTEAEWEYACRAGTATPFHFGETISTELANYRGTEGEYQGQVYSGIYGRGVQGIYREQTTPVGSFPHNAFGLYDMHGNVWEWCEDDWHEDYQGASTDGRVWLTGKNPRKKALRGGSWYNFPWCCRSAFRSLNPCQAHLNSFGFRVVYIPPGT